jgi:uncharacterized protein (UPF0333 family)
MEEVVRPNAERGQLLLSIAVIVALGIIAYFAYSITRHDESASQAKVIARTFIQSSPVLQTDLGKVTAIKELDEKHEAGTKPLWLIDYNVTGQKSSGTVEMKLRRVEGLWNVPSAELHVDHQPPINLR